MNSIDELSSSSFPPPPGGAVNRRTISLKTDDTEFSSEAVSGSSDDEDDHDKYDWEREKYRKIQFFDDGTMSYFWRAHTLTVLFLMISVLVYVSMFEQIRDDSEYNTKRGMVACLLVFILLGVTIIPDGPFLRPHPAFWRLMFCLSIVYELCLIFVLFQSAVDARLLLKHIDPKLGVELEEKSYGGNCFLYDPAVPDDPFHNIWDKCDLFVPTHFFGWWLKTLILRDWWLCSVISIMFEILEYTLEHQLPNFSECWWDHWIMDALICNGLGIYVGIKTLKYLKVKTYYWRGLWSIPGYRGKLRRILGQFGPKTWIQYDWRPASTFGRWAGTIGIMSLFLLAELNTFYLKFVLWVPPGHWLNLVRLFAILIWGAVALRESFQYLDDPGCNTFGRQSWIILAIISTEFLVVAKFDPVTITKPLPRHIVLFWSIGLFILILWTVWNFVINPYIRGRSPQTRLQSVMNSKSDNHIRRFEGQHQGPRNLSGSRTHRKAHSASAGMSATTMRPKVATYKTNNAKIS